MTKSSNYPSHTYCAVDPGVTGALAFFDYQGHLLELMDMPVIEVKKGKRKTQVLDDSRIVHTLISWHTNHVFLELSQARPAKRGGKTITPGIVSTGNFMKHYGILVGICAGLLISCTEITPSAWKRKVMSGMGKDKGASLIRAAELYPDTVLSRKKDHGKADALLIGWYAATEILRVYENKDNTVLQFFSK